MNKPNHRRKFLATTGAAVAGTLVAPQPGFAARPRAKMRVAMAGTRDGAMSILVGIAARKSVESGQPVKIADLTSLTPRAKRA